MRVGFFAPLPPARTGVADYAERLLQAMRPRGRVDVSPAKSDINLYHLGNNQLHAEIYARALREPGVVVLHDAVLHHFALGYFNREKYIGEFVYNYGDWSRDLAVHLWDHRARSAADNRYFAYPMLRRVVERSRAVVVHNPSAARMVAAHVPDARVVQIPHIAFENQPADAADILRLREELGIRPLEFVCGVFGYLRESKRIRSLIDACGRADITLIIGGECPSDLARSLEPHLRRPFVRRVPFTSLREFNLLIRSVDLCASLRYPAAGETSGLTIRLMGAGKCVLMTDAEENRPYPEDACVRIDSGLAETAHLTAALEWLKTCPSDAQAIGIRAAEYIRAVHDPQRVADLFWQILSSA